MSDGMRSGVDWMRLNEEVERPRDGADQQRFGEAGRADEQRVPPAEDGDEHLVDHVGLADDHAGDLRAQGFMGCLQLPDEVQLVRRRNLAHVVSRGDGWPILARGGRDGNSGVHAVAE
ncbi:MAG: hypothetical protein U1G05_04970 [Kiritimatiellia bacterium]